MNKKILGLIICLITLLGINVGLAILYMQKNVTLTGGVTVFGDITVYGPDGISELTLFDFPIFNGGEPGGWFSTFFVNNTGTQQVTVYWNISSSTISWEKDAIIDIYNHPEDTVNKYFFYVAENPSPIDYWIPDTEGIVIDAGEGIEFAFSLGYYGEPITAETFELVASFYAYDA